MDSNLNILVEAKKEYLGQLCLIMSPAIIEVLQEMYDEATKMSKGKKVLVTYQNLLREVQNWSNAMSKKHSDNITNRCSYFNDLLAAVFVACVKILSSVRLRSDNQKINLKLPSNEVFIQTVYNNVAKDIYRDPYVMHESQSEAKRDDELNVRIAVCIEATVKELIPVQQILQTYVSQSDANIDLDGTEGLGDTEDPEFQDEEEYAETEEGEGEGEGEATDEGEPTGATDAGEVMEPVAPQQPVPEFQSAPPPPAMPTGLENEFKTIPNVRKQDLREEVEEEEDDVFFPDAAEKKTSRY